MEENNNQNVQTNPIDIPVEINRNLDDIVAVEPNQLVDFSAYEGLRFKIAGVKELEVINKFNGPKDVTGKPSYNPNSTEKKHIIEVTTVPLTKLDNSRNPTDELVDMGEGRNLTVRQQFNLKKETKDDGSIDWVISKHVKGSLWKFMRKLGVENLDALKGLFVTLTVVKSNSPEDDRDFLRIVC